MNFKFEKLLEYLKYLLAAVAVGYIVLNVFVVVNRIFYPFELEWMEGGVVDHISRILNGKNLYVEPSLKFVPYIYPPFYFYLSALVSRIIGVGFLAPRLLSYFCTLLSFYFIFLIVYRKTKEITWGLVAAGLFAATYKISGGWFDIARVDMLGLLLVLVPFYLALFKEGNKYVVLSGILVALAFFTKQTMVLAAFPIAYVYLIKNRRHFIYFSVVSSVLVFGGIFIINYLTDGWFYYYIFKLPASQEIESVRHKIFWNTDVFPHLLISISLIVLYLVWPPFKKYFRDRLVFLFFILTVMVISILGRLHTAGWINVIIPFFAGTAILLGIAADSLWKKSREYTRNFGYYFNLLLIVLILSQFGRLYYPPGEEIPTDQDRRAGEELFKKLAPIKGDIIFPWHGFYSSMAGDGSWASMMAVQDIKRTGDKKNFNKFLDQYMAALKDKKFSAIVAEDLWPDYRVLDEYKIYDLVFNDDSVFRPVTGYALRPEMILVPRENDEDMAYKPGPGAPPKQIFDRFLSIASPSVVLRELGKVETSGYADWINLLPEAKSHVFGNTIELLNAYLVVEKEKSFFIFEFKSHKKMEKDFVTSLHVTALKEDGDKFYNFDFRPYPRTGSWKPGTIIINHRITEPLGPGKYIFTLSFYAGSESLGPVYRKEFQILP